MPAYPTMGESYKLCSRIAQAMTSYKARCATLISINPNFALLIDAIKNKKFEEVQTILRSMNEAQILDPNLIYLALVQAALMFNSNEITDEDGPEYQIIKALFANSGCLPGHLAPWVIAIQANCSLLIKVLQQNNFSVFSFVYVQDKTFSPAFITRNNKLLQLIVESTEGNKDCPICCLPLKDKNLNALPCGHIVCSDCLEGQITHAAEQRTPFKCPVCRAQFDL
jgi:hypothetical protein